MFLFGVAIVGVIRYFQVPRLGEPRSGRLVVAQRLPVEFWAAGLTLVTFAAWWAFSGLHVIVEPNLPALVAIAPLITAMAYRGAKWILTLGGLLTVGAVAYLIGLILARSTQLIITLVYAFQR